MSASTTVLKPSSTQSEVTLSRLLDERATNQMLHENVLETIERREDKQPTESEAQQLTIYREKAAELDVQITELADAVEKHRTSVEASKAIRRAMMAGSADGVEAGGDGIIYRDFKAYARDMLLARSIHSTGELAKLAGNWGGEEEVQRAQERLQLLKRIPANTLTSDVPGLSPDQHIAQIFQVIEAERPIVQSAQRTTLEKLTLSYPQIDASPVVAVQATQKTEAGNTGLDVSMQTATASTYLGGGNISWQAAEFTTPNALDLWFRLVAADYALKTETDAATVISADAFLNLVSSPLGATPSFADFMAAVGRGGGEVYANSSRMANTVYMAPDRYWYLFGTTSDAAAQFTTVSGEGVGPLRFIASRGLNAGEIIVGDSDGLLVAESAGAPVQLRVVEPAIGGFEVGLIGLFEAVVVDPGSFALITTAS